MPAAEAVNTIRAIRRDLAKARAEQVLRVVAVVDAMAERGAAEALIEPLRPQLARLHPHRPLRLARLLFTPVDPLIVPPRRWTPDGLLIPRTALSCLHGLVREGLGDSAAKLERMMSGHDDHDLDASLAVGARLWTAASVILARAKLPLNWGETGLRAVAFEPLARTLAVLLGQGAAIHRLSHAGVADAAPVRALFEATLPHGAWARAAAILLARVPDPFPVLAAMADCARGDTAARTLTGAATEATLDRIDDHAGTMQSADLAEAAAEAARGAALLALLDTPAIPAAQRTRLRAIRQSLAAGCRARFAVGLADEVLKPLRDLTDGRVDGGPEPLEAAARDLRRLEQHARRLDGGAEYDGALRAAAKTVGGLHDGCALTMPDRARLVEILVGPDAALQLFS